MEKEDYSREDAIKLVGKTLSVEDVDCAEVWRLHAAETIWPDVYSLVKSALIFHLVMDYSYFCIVTKSSSMDKRLIRIFISSPGDVYQERQIARNVISDLSKLYNDYANIESLLWEDFPLDATSTFQDGIDFFLEQGRIDIAVFILWSRLGSPLGKNVVDEDGHRYQSGTEYEYRMMQKLRQASGDFPKMLVYIKNKDVCAPLTEGTIQELDEALSQKRKVKEFISENFYDAATQSHYAFAEFEDSISFEDRLRTHLDKCIKQILGDIQIQAKWDSNPYMGLRTFTEKESSIFFGRKVVIYDIVSSISSLVLQEQSPILFLFGSSGSGKSSLIQGGLLPFYTQNRVGSYKMESIRIVPSLLNGNLHIGFLSVVNTIYINAERYLEGRDAALQYIDDRIKKILFIDQFEEIFSSSFSENDRQSFLEILKKIALAGNTWLFVTCRSDFYYQFIRYDSLVELKSSAIVKDVPTITASQLSEIINAPAAMAGCKWEINDKGIALNEVFIAEADRVRSLPLIEFALSHLWDNRNDSNCLTFSAYKSMGGITGAIVNYADKWYGALAKSEKENFTNLLAWVVALDKDSGKPTRKTTLRTKMEASGVVPSLIDKMISSHLLVSDKDSDGMSTVTITHEILLSEWPLVVDWIKIQEDFLAQNNHMHELSSFWIVNGYRQKDLIKEKDLLEEAEFFLFKSERRLDAGVVQFIRTSIRKRINKQFPFWLSVSLLSLLFLIVFMIPGAWSYLLTDPEYMDMLSEVTMGEIVVLAFVATVISIYSAWKRYVGKPRYETVKGDVAVWSIMMVISISYMFSGDYDPLFSIIFTLPIVFKELSVLLEYRQINKWKHEEKYKITKGNSLLTRFKNVFVALFFIMIIFMSLVSISIINTEKMERVDKVLEQTQLVYQGIHRVNGQLSVADLVFVDQKYCEYLDANFPSQLYDSKYNEDEDYDFEYALSKFNLYETNSALGHLYPDSDINHKLLASYCYLQKGSLDVARMYLSEYIQSHGLANFSIPGKNNHNQIWCAEVLGLFDDVKYLYELLPGRDDSWQNNCNYLVNLGHVYVHENNIPKALEYYNKATERFIADNNYYKETITRDDIRSIIERDLELLKWYGAIDGKLVDKVLKKMNLPVMDYRFCSGECIDDDVENLLVGKWRSSDGLWVMEIHPKDSSNDMYYHVTSTLYKSDASDADEMQRDSYLGIARKLNDGTVVWEEADLKTVFSFDIVYVSSDELHLIYKDLINHGLNDTGYNYRREY